MTVGLYTETKYIERRATGYANSVNTDAFKVAYIKIEGPGHIYTQCDCHYLVWNAQQLIYRPGADIFECPLQTQENS